MEFVKESVKQVAESGSLLVAFGIADVAFRVFLDGQDWKNMEMYKRAAIDVGILAVAIPGSKFVGMESETLFKK